MNGDGCADDCGFRDPLHRPSPCRLMTRLMPTPSPSGSPACWASAPSKTSVHSRIYTRLPRRNCLASPLRILRRQDWAEEVLQECYVNIWNHAGDYAAARSAPLTWMTSIVRNRCARLAAPAARRDDGRGIRDRRRSLAGPGARTDGAARCRGRRGRARSAACSNWKRSSGRASCSRFFTACRIPSWRTT